MLIQARTIPAKSLETLTPIFVFYPSCPSSLEINVAIPWPEACYEATVVSQSRILARAWQRQILEARIEGVLYTDQIWYHILEMPHL